MKISRKTTTVTALVLAASAFGGVNGHIPASRALAAASARPRAAAKHIQATTVNGTYAFSPKTAKIKIGTKVTWLNVSQAPHTVTGTGAWKFSSKTFNQNGSVSYIFKKPGTYHYKCAIHPYMKGTVVVTK